MHHSRKGSFPELPFPGALIRTLQEREMPDSNEINKLIDNGIDCYDRLEDYAEKLKSEVNKAMQKALKTKSDRELQSIRQSIELNNRYAARLRFALKTQERSMVGLINGIDIILKELGSHPENLFINSLTEIQNLTKGKNSEEYDIETGEKIDKNELNESFMIREDINCPYCGELNLNFKFGESCHACHAPISVPWKEFTTCPACQSIINTHDIITDPIAYSLDNERIDCPYCDKKFEYKNHITEPEMRSLKVCTYCDTPYIPGKRSWRNQRTCSKACNDKLFNQENPGYQKKYRSKKK